MVEKKPQTERRYFMMHITTTTKRLVCRMYEKLFWLKTTTKPPTRPREKCADDLSKQFTKEVTQIDKHRKTSSTLLEITKMAIKT